MAAPAGVIRKTGSWLIVVALLFIALGTIAIVEPMVAGLAVAILAGWLLIVGGVAHAIAVFSGGGIGRVVWQIVLAILYLWGGWYLLTHPLLGLGTLTLVLAGILLAEAVLETIAYFQTRAELGAGWRLVNAVITLVLGGMIWLNWPSSSVWAIGTIVGVNLLTTGLTRLMLGFAARRVASQLGG